MRPVSRRTILTGSVGLFLPCSAMARTPDTSATMVVTRNPGCGCCSAWIEHVRSAGFQVEVIDSQDLAPLKARLGIPTRLVSCHTAEIGGYVLEGHVPAPAIERLLAERPDATGLAVPGMPIGSPGMEISGSSDESYEVVLFGPSSERTYARFHGHRELK